MVWRPSGVITLLTDFGLKDPFVGVMKGVVLGINPEARIVDITHGVEPHNVVQAGFLLHIAHRFFPGGTVHVAVVDPGVGGSRRPLLAVTDSYVFVGPDNGVLSPAFEESRASRAFALTAARFFLPEVGSTFHGRDVFAPVAAWLSKGVAPEEFGKEVSDHSRIALPRPSPMGEGGLRGEVLYIDRFGNAMTSVTATDLDRIAPRHRWGSVCIRVKGVEALGLSRCYEESAPGVPGALVNSWGCVEIFLARGSAADKLRLGRGDAVEVFLAAAGRAGGRSGGA